MIHKSVSVCRSNLLTGSHACTALVRDCPVANIGVYARLVTSLGLYEIVFGAWHRLQYHQLMQKGCLGRVIGTNLPGHDSGFARLLLLVKWWWDMTLHSSIPFKRLPVSSRPSADPTWRIFYLLVEVVEEFWLRGGNCDRRPVLPSHHHPVIQQSLYSYSDLRFFSRLGSVVPIFFPIKTFVGLTPFVVQEVDR